MDASQSFATLLRSIESSNLNYSMTRTPFSATVSLKCSYVKRFTEVSPTQENKYVTNLSYKEVQLLEMKMKKLESENLELKTKVKDLENSADLGKEKLKEAVVKLQEAYDQEKAKVEDSDNKVVEFREEILKIKREKHNLILDLKAQRETSEEFKQESKVLKNENESINKMLKDNLKLLDTKLVELNNARKEIKRIKQALVEVQIELDQSKLQEIRTEIKCDECDTRLQSSDQLKLHIRQNHSRNKSTQYETISNFLNYQCFYCDKSIISKDDLKEHTTVCSEVLDILVTTRDQEVDVFPCNECGAECINFDDLGRHMTTYHSQGTLLEDPGVGDFWCDICPLYFESNFDLQFHKRACHWDHL